VKQLPQPAQSLQRVDDTHWRVMPVAPTEQPISVTMSDGNVQAIPFRRVEAVFKARPKINQDSWLKAGGGEAAQYGPTCEILCDCVPPLLLRRPAPQRGYEPAGDEVYMAGWWDEVVNKD
jgi:hypothetical protein